MEYSRNAKLEVDLNDSAAEVNFARGRFETALLDLQSKDETSESDIESDSEAMNRPVSTGSQQKSSPREASIAKPVRKRRRKDHDMREDNFHHTFVMRLFDRSVDLAQFEESSPLYPICRAWMLNQPHNTDLGTKKDKNVTKDEGLDDLFQTKINKSGSPLVEVTEMPSPEPWKTTDRRDPRLPCSISKPLVGLKVIEEEALRASTITSQAILNEHLMNWKAIRNQWKKTSQEADARYASTHQLLKSMFQR